MSEVSETHKVRLDIIRPLKILLEKIERSGLLAIFSMELRTIINSRKFKIFLFIMFFPILTLVLTTNSPGSFTEKAFEWVIGSTILNFWAGLPGQITIILIASELIAREFEKETIKLIFNTPTRKTNIVLGKFLALSILILITAYFNITIYAYLLDIKNNMNGEYFTKHFWEINLAILITFLGLLTISSIAIIISALSRKSLYAGVISILTLIGTMILPYLIPMLSNPEVYTINYQLGVILEEIFWLGTDNVYPGNPFIAFNALYIINAISIIITCLIISRVEVI